MNELDLIEASDADIEDIEKVMRHIGDTFRRKNLCPALALPALLGLVRRLTDEYGISDAQLMEYYKRIQVHSSETCKATKGT